MTGRPSRAAIDPGDDVERVHWFAVVGVLGAALAAGVWFGRGAAPQPVPVVDRTPGVTATTADAGITAHVSGAVAEPGLVEIAAGSRVADAVAAAGGALPTADLGRLNLAATVVDGSQVVVPEFGEHPVFVNEGSSPGPLRLNSATVEQLQQLPGIGPVTAQRIVSHRETNGPFRVIEDLLDVPGIGEGRLATLRDLVVVP